MANHDTGEHDTLSVRKRIGALIRARRATLRMEQRELAARSGISQAALSKYESASAAMRAEDLPRLAVPLGISPCRFFEESTLDELGIDWQAVEGGLVENWRALPPGERIAAAEQMQMRAIGMAQNSEDDDSGLLSDWRQKIDHPLPRNVL